jgi:Ring finger domain
MPNYTSPYMSPIYKLLNPGLERRLSYDQYTRTRQQRTRHRRTRQQSVPYIPIEQHSESRSTPHVQHESTNTSRNQDDYTNTINQYRFEPLSNQITLRNLLLKTTIMINKENGLCCAICQDDILQDTEIIRKLECNHIYHIHCIDNWLVLKMECPMCKYVI